MHTPTECFESTNTKLGVCYSQTQNIHLYQKFSVLSILQYYIKSKNIVTHLHLIVIITQRYIKENEKQIGIDFFCRKLACGYEI